MNLEISERGRWAGLPLAIALAAASAVAVPAADHGQPDKLSAKVRQAAKQADNLDVIVRYHRQPGQGERSLVQELGGEIRRQLRSSRGLAVHLPTKALEALSADPAVEFVASDAPTAVAMDVARVAAGLPAPSAPESSLKGAGVTVAVLDSGVALHPELKTLIAAVDLVGDRDGVLTPPTSVDPNDHGTHVAGIIAADGSRSAGRYAGIAPEASLVSVRVVDDLGVGRTSDVIAGLDWVLAQKERYGIRVVNLSLGHPIYEPAEQDPLVLAAEAVWDAGIVVVCSAGNDGREGFATITSPCNSRKLISVGALDDRNTPEHGDDTVASFSSRGPTLFDLFAKPDLLAPGNRIVSLRAAGSSLDKPHPKMHVAGGRFPPSVFGHYQMSGTSMAAPFVSATAALMLQQEPWLNPATVKARLMLSAKKAAAGDPFATGAGALDITAALRTSGAVAAAPSPQVLRDVATGRVGFENTAVLWSDASFDLMSLWPTSVLWSDPTAWYQSPLWSDGVQLDAALWPDATVTTQATLWPDTMLWTEAVIWPDGTDSGYLQAEAVLWPDGPRANSPAHRRPVKP